MQEGKQEVTEVTAHVESVHGIRPGSFLRIVTLACKEDSDMTRARKPPIRHSSWAALARHAEQRQRRCLAQTASLNTCGTVTTSRLFRSMRWSAL
jgi:hypothetical protein